MGWMVWMFERVGKMNGNISSWQFWQQHIHILLACNARLLIQATSVNSKQTTLAGYTQTTMSLLNHAPEFGNRLEDNFFLKILFQFELSYPGIHLLNLLLIICCSLRLIEAKNTCHISQCFPLPGINLRRMKFTLKEQFLNGSTFLKCF